MLTTTRAARSCRLLSQRCYATTAKVKPSKQEGDISSVFVSLSGGASPELAERYANVKSALVRGKEKQISNSWKRLLEELQHEKTLVRAKGPSIIPQIPFSELDHPSEAFIRELKHRGVAVVRGVIDEREARAYKEQVEDYVRANPWTKAFPSHDPQVFELYWSAPQIAARSHPNLLQTQRFLMGMWHSKDPTALISTARPLTYADRLRIRKPGDSGFALGPHIDGGSVERWEPDGYGRGSVYEKIWEGNWEQYDPWEASCRVPVNSDLYNGAGACSMFRMFQGWLSMSHTNPGEGTLMVNPLLQMSTAYLLLRPFFEPVQKPQSLMAGQHDSSFLDASNWRMKDLDKMTPELQGANPGHAQELNQVLHPHLDLQNTMVHVPSIRPGDFVVWHCDSIHAVDKIHAGKTDSSVMYIPVCPTTEANAAYIARQRETLYKGLPGPDFPGGKGESEHTGRPTEAYLRTHCSNDALQSLGLERLNEMDWQNTIGARKVLQKANATLGYA
ncbi:DUF1479 domain protein [Myriangium duriaei CBS 260.36]|uniref:DUF1479 domain protein n=1 Tax=Myriangium duriaei CBS 260.36 TaxID=1168546 RepID=A0A9P4MFC6_9PEZI|nr:DUF1479 domain protein [Myriangium duriaei CBS 260.36]